jgi:DNA-binding MarR family transcriptional regulator
LNWLCIAKNDDKYIVDIATKRRIQERAMSTGAEPGPHYAALLQLLRTAETIWNASRVFFARWDLSPAQFNLLNLLTDQPAGLTQSDLSRELLTHRSNVTGLVDRLEQRGLVERRERKDDRRAWRVVLMPQGRKLLAEVLPHYYEAAEAVWQEVPVTRANAVVMELKRVAVNAESAAARLARQDA